MVLDRNARSTIKNFCPWTVSFTLPISNASILLEANKKTSINNDELITLLENQNVMFAGSGNGNHARIYVENEKLRKYVGYDSEDGSQKQFVLTDEECQKILDCKTLNTFKRYVEEKIVANHEKAKIIEYARKNKLNNYEMIDFLESHCGIPFKVKEQ
jgi:hypothetical protein